MNQDVIYLPKEKILKAASELPTPFFLYEERRFLENVRGFRDTFKNKFPNFQPLYAVKANPNPEILKLLIREGFGFDTSSYSEAWMAKKLGANGMHTGSYIRTEDLAMAKEAGLILNLDDITTLDQVEEVGIPETLSFRINPGIGKGEVNSFVFAGEDAKYGIPFEKAATAYKKAKEMGVKNLGIHMMTGSNVREEDYFVLIVERLLNVIGEIKEKTGVEIEFMNIGGGFGVPYRPEEKTLDLEKIAADLRELMDRKCTELNIQEPQLYAEPGRSSAADMGWLVGKVVALKDGYKKFVGIDASSNDMPRPAIYDAYHHITILNDSKETETVSIVGSICENSDQFGKNRELPVCSIDDVVAIHNCGAHAHAMGHNYNGKLRHAEYLLQEDGEIRQIRRAETIEDLFTTVNF